jgi:HD-like signal output (HDOD) protein
VQYAPARDSEWAFMAGLLHDIGLLLIAAGLPAQFKRISEQPVNEIQLIEREREVLGFTHFDLGAEMLAQWNCPPTMQEAARFCERTAFQCERPLSLGAVVKTASLLADASQINLCDANQDRTLASELLDAVGIADSAKFTKAFEAEYSGLLSCAA